MAQIAVAILHHKKPKLTIDCLESLKQQTYQDFHIYLLIQGASAEDQITLHNLYDEWDKITIIDSDTNHGFAEGNNIIIRQALNDQTVKFIVTLNNDTIVKPEFLEKIIIPFNQKQVGMVQAKMLKMTDPKQVDCLGIELMQSGIAFNIKSQTPNKKLFCPSAGAAAYSRELLQRIKQAKQVSRGFEARIEYDYFDSRFFAYSEDLDLGFRARHAGFTAALADQAICLHLGSATTTTMSDLAIYHSYRNLIWTLYKNMPPNLLIKLSPLMIAGLVALSLNFLKKRKAKIFLKALKDGFNKISAFKPDRQFILVNSKLPPAKLKTYISQGIIDSDYL